MASVNVPGERGRLFFLAVQRRRRARCGIRRFFEAEPSGERRRLGRHSAHLARRIGRAFPAAASRPLESASKDGSRTLRAKSSNSVKARHFLLVQGNRRSAIRCVINGHGDSRAGLVPTSNRDGARVSRFTRRPLRAKKQPGRRILPEAGRVEKTRLVFEVKSRMM